MYEPDDYEVGEIERKREIKKMLEDGTHDTNKILDIIYELEREICFVNIIQLSRKRQLKKLIKRIKNKDKQEEKIKKKAKKIKKSLDE